MKKKQLIAVIFLMVAFLIAFGNLLGEPGACRDCGGINNCLYTNGFGSGYGTCRIWQNPLTDEIECHLEFDTWGDCIATPV